MKIEQTKLDGVVVITPNRFGDDRGFFSECWNRKALAENGIDIDFVQDNHSLSSKKGTLRGLHLQMPPFAQDKLVRCGRGSILDVAVDIRKNSPTFKQWHAEVLSAENGKQLMVPIGFAHGFVTLEDDSEVCYKCSNYYSGVSDRSLRFDDPEFGVDWGDGPFTLSDKDKNALAFADFDTPF